MTGSLVPTRRAGGVSYEHLVLHIVAMATSTPGAGDEAAR
jgi:hypothetical protein